MKDIVDHTLVLDGIHHCLGQCNDFNPPPPIPGANIPVVCAVVGILEQGSDHLVLGQTRKMSQISQFVYKVPPHFLHLWRWSEKGLDGVPGGREHLHHPSSEHVP